MAQVPLIHEWEIPEPFEMPALIEFVKLSPPIAVQPSPESGVRIRVRTSVVNPNASTFNGRIEILVDGKKVGEIPVYVAPKSKSVVGTVIQLPSVCTEVNGETVCERRAFAVSVLLKDARGETLDGVELGVEVFPPPTQGGYSGSGG